GSIYVRTKVLTGTGQFNAGGGGPFTGGWLGRPGGGGRIALYYDTSTFTGQALAPGGCFSGQCAGDGTVTVNGVPPCTADCFSNVLFIPGLEASRLYKPISGGGETQLWEPGGNSDAVQLMLNPDGTSINPDIYA